MGDGVNIAARLEGVAEPGAICLSEDAYRQVKARLDLAVSDLGPTQLKNIAEPMRVYSLEVGQPAQAKPAPSRAGDQAKRRRPRGRLASGPLAAVDRRACSFLAAASGWLSRRGPAAAAAKLRIFRSWYCPSANLSGDPSSRLFRRRRHREPHDRPLAHPRQLRDRPQYRLHLQGQEHRRQGDRQGAWRALCARRLGAARPESGARQRAADRCRDRRSLWADRFEEDIGRSVQAAGSGGGAIGQCLELRARHGRSGEGSPLAKSGRHCPGCALIGRKPALIGQNRRDMGRRISGSS